MNDIPTTSYNTHMPLKINRVRKTFSRGPTFVILEIVIRMRIMRVGTAFLD
jgi:hypothetical protein